MSSIYPPYKYKGLLWKSSQQQLWHMFTIRVLVLEPASCSDDDLICSFSYLQLPSKRLFLDEFRFEAISYAWGDPALTHFIICEGHTIRITANADQVLRRFRKIDKARRLWIDAICINQTDNDEKAQQVQLMSEIYTSKETLVWLGGTVHPNCIDFLWGLSSSKYEHISTPDEADNAVRYELRRFFGDESFDHMLAFASLPWFKRRWTVQEAALSAPHIYCGDSDITWHAFNHAARLLSLSSFPVDSQLLNHVKTIDSLNSDRVDSWDILTCMVDFAHTQTFDPRDKIYALLSLAEDVDKSIFEANGSVSNRTRGVFRFKPDYKLGTELVYQNFATTLLRKRAHLEILQCAGAFPRTSVSWPSWMPDWRSPIQYTPLINVPWFTAGPTKFSSLEGKASICYPWCSVQGIVVDSIDLVLTYSEADLMRTGPNDFLLEAFREFPIFDDYITGEKLWQAMALTFIADHALDRRLGTRFIKGQDYWYDGQVMKRDSRERDTQVLFDWFMTVFEDNPEAFRNEKRVRHTFPQDSTVEVMRRANELLPTLHHSIYSSAYNKTSQSRNDWHETSSTSRSGVHQAIHPTDLPYWMKSMHEEALKNGIEPNQHYEWEGKRGEHMSTVPAKQASEVGATLDNLFPNPREKSSDLNQIEYEAAQPSSEKIAQAVKARDNELGDTTKDIDDIDWDELLENSSNDEVSDNGSAKAIVNPKLDKFLQAQRDSIAEQRAEFHEMLGAIAMDDTASTITHLQNANNRAETRLVELINRMIGHSDVNVLRAHGLDKVADTIERMNREGKPTHVNDNSSQSDGEKDGESNGDPDDETLSSSDPFNDEEDECTADKSGYKYMADIGALRGDEDGYLFFKPDSQDTYRCAELVRQTMHGRAFVCTKLGLVGLVPASTRVGDSIAVFRGGRTPFVVRKCSDSAAHQLMGDAYMHGIMRGEAFQVPALKEQDFVLL